MTKNEALKAAIDGKKVRNTRWSQPEIDSIWFDGRNFRFGNNRVSLVVGSALDYEYGWQIVPEYVDFSEAWDAYEAGKAIQAQNSGITYHQRNKFLQGFIISDVRGKWLILEGN